RRIVRAPSTRHARLLVSQLPRLERRYRQQHGRAPDAETIARALELDVAEVRELEAALYGHDLPCGPSGHDRGCELASEALSPENLMAEAEAAHAERKRVQHALAQLPRREREIMEQRHMGDETPSLVAMGRDFGVSRERIRQLETRARDKLRKLLEVA